MAISHGFTEASDADLLDRVWDRGAFDELYRRYQPRLVRMCSRIVRDRGLGEDLAQETLAAAMTKADLYDPSRPAWPWLRAIAVNQCLGHLRRQDATELHAPIAPAADPLSLIGERELLALALGRLPARQRVAVGLRYVHDWSGADVAGFMGLTPSGLDQLLCRGRARLRTEYRRLSDGAGRLVAILSPMGFTRRWARRVGEGTAAASPAATASGLAVGSAVALTTAVTAAISMTATLVALAPPASALGTPLAVASVSAASPGDLTPDLGAAGLGHLTLEIARLDAGASAPADPDPGSDSGETAPPLGIETPEATAPVPPIETTPPIQRRETEDGTAYEKPPTTVDPSGLPDVDLLPSAPAGPESSDDGEDQDSLVDTGSTGVHCADDPTGQGAVTSLLCPVLDGATSP